MPRDLIIDGYNVLHAAGLARPTYGPGGLERARNRLLKRLHKLLSTEEIPRTTVVFDGQGDEIQHAQRQHGLRVIYSPERAEADDVIERLIAAHSAPKQLTIVSSDHRLHKAARRRKARAIDSDRFLDQAEQRQVTASTPQRELTAEPIPEEMDDTELAEWLELFSDVNVAQISDGIRRELKAVARQQPKPNHPSLHSTQASPPNPVPAQSEKQPPTDAKPATEPLNSPVDDNELDNWRERIQQLLDEEGLGDRVRWE